MDSPGFNGCTHQQGQPFGTWPDEPNWAGKGFTVVVTSDDASEPGDTGQVSDQAA